MSADTGDRISRIYGNFRGVDFRGEEVHLSRSPNSLNMWKDYRETDSIRTRPQLDLFASTGFGGKIYGIFFYKNYMFVHQNAFLFRFDTSVKNWENPKTDSFVYTGMNGRQSSFFTYNGKMYVLDGKNYLVYNDDDSPLSDVKGYIPTTSIGRKPEGGGTIHQDVNLISNRRINTFLADGTSTKYILDAICDGDDNGDMIVTVNGAVKTQGKDYTQAFDNAGNMIGITFTSAPPKPLTDGQDNVSIEFAARNTGNRNKISGCTLLQVFDNRVFVGGNPNYPNVIWHSSLNDPTYFSDLDYYEEGIDNAAITGLVTGNNALWVFREPSDTNTTVFYHTPTVDPEYGTIYPSSHSSISTGCVGKAINFNDDVVFFSSRGMEGVSGNITTEQFVSHRSSLVDRQLTAFDYRDMFVEKWDGYLVVGSYNRMFLADSRAIFTNVDHNEYEWFYWVFSEINAGITLAKCHKDVLYVATDNGEIYVLHSDYVRIQSANKPISCHSAWVTPKDRFGAPQKLKTSNKRGCVVEATGNIKVSVKTEDTEFEEVGTYENVTDYFCCRIKRKKWKDIQLKFESDRKFSLETATLEAFIGGYLKR